MDDYSGTFPNTPTALPETTSTLPDAPSTLPDAPNIFALPTALLWHFLIHHSVTPLYHTTLSHFSVTPQVDAPALERVIPAHFLMFHTDRKHAGPPL